MINTMDVVMSKIETCPYNSLTSVLVLTTK
jgi:hypothetical protein